MSLGLTRFRLEAQAVRAAIEDAQWNVKTAATVLGISQTALKDRLRAHGLRRPREFYRRPAAVRSRRLAVADLQRLAGSDRPCCSIHRWQSVADGQWVCTVCPAHRSEAAM